MVALIRGTPNERVVWPWPVRSSARTTSPGPKRRVAPSPIPISICPARIKMYCRRGAVCQSLRWSAGKQRTRGWHPPEAQRCGSPRPAEGDLQNGSGRRGPYISVRSCACSFPQRDQRARKGVLRVIADDETSGILAPHASTGMFAESMKLIVVRPLLIDCLHALEEAVTLGYPIRHRLVRWKRAEKDARGFVVGDDAEYAFDAR